MGPVLPVIVGELLVGTGAGALALVALADLGATYAGWTPVAARPALAVAAGAGLALVVVGAIAAVVPQARAVASRNIAPERRTSRAARGLPLALVLAAAAFVVVLALEVRPRRVWALSTVTMLLAWAVLAFRAEARHGASSIRDAVCALGAGAVIVEAVVRPAVGPTWVAATGLGFLVAAWVTEERARPAHRPWPAFVSGIAIALAFVVPALWLVAGLAEPGAGLAASASCIAGFALLRSGAGV
jgi:hypothetical protein